jgi:hypothetical protein
MVEKSKSWKIHRLVQQMKHLLNSNGPHTRRR